MSESEKQQGQSPERNEPEPAAVSAAALIFDDPMSVQSSDDTDRGWGEGSYGGGAGSSAGDLARFLDEKPPHHI